MSAGRGKIGLVVVLALVAMAMASMLFLKNQLSTATAKRAKGTTSPSPETKSAEPEAESKTRLAVLIVDPFARSAPHQTAIAMPVGTGSTADSASGTRNLPPPSFTPIDRSEAPFMISPSPMLGHIPSAIQTGSAPSGPTEDDPKAEPPAAPVQVHVRGIVGADRPRAFLQINGSTRTVQSGTDLGDGMRVRRVTNTHVEIERNGKSTTVPVGKETNL